MYWAEGVEEHEGASHQYRLGSIWKRRKAMREISGADEGFGYAVDPHLGDAVCPSGEKSSSSKECQRLTLSGKEEWSVRVLHEPVVPRYVTRAPAYEENVKGMVFISHIVDKNV